QCVPDAATSAGTFAPAVATWAATPLATPASNNNNNNNNSNNNNHSNNNNNTPVVVTPAITAPASPVAPLLAPAPVSLTELMLSGSASSSDPPPGPVTGAADTLAEASGASVTAAYVAEADSASSLQNQLLSFEALAFGSQPPPVIDAVNSQPRKLYRLAFHDPITRRPIPPGSKEFFDLLRTLGEDCPETAFHLRMP
ncbi:unnamed protein product, partial [Polarella glacialis]